MADLVQTDRALVRPALEARHQMMATGLCLGWDWPAAKRTDLRLTPGCRGLSLSLSNGEIDLAGRRTHSASKASRSFLVIRSLSLLSCPQAAKMSRPRGVRTGLA